MHQPRLAVRACIIPLFFILQFVALEHDVIVVILLVVGIHVFEFGVLIFFSGHVRTE